VGDMRGRIDSELRKAGQGLLQTGGEFRLAEHPVLEMPMGGLFCRLLGVEDDPRTLPPRLMEEIAALSLPRMGEP